VADFIERIAGDVLRAVAVQKLQRELIVVLRAAGDAAEFGVLDPEIGLDQFGGGQKTQNRDIAAGEWTFKT
jgi:hypothetical protein